MVERTAAIKNRAGIHVRPSGVIIGALNELPVDVRAESDGYEVELNSVMALLSLGLVAGDRVKLKIEGSEAQKYADQIVELFERRYDFPPKENTPQKE
ncbi:MAG TPA: HPr family phosphocarrier protein [Sediminispirochaeta sp.]|nr:HPr family phosphocarrier protein [Sediminispirochaeta sp.]